MTDKEAARAVRTAAGQPAKPPVRESTVLSLNPLACATHFTLYQAYEAHLSAKP